MDCLTCQGTGEYEISTNQLQSPHSEMNHTEREGNRSLWSYSCPVCGGSGLVEESV